MTDPTSFAVEGRIQWHNDHACPYEAGADLAKALDGSDFKVVTDEANSEHILLREDSE